MARPTVMTPEVIAKLEEALQMADNLDERYGMSDYVPVRRKT